jgi:hypothetical protein
MKRKLAADYTKKSETTSLLIEDKQLPKRTEKNPKQRKYCGEYDCSQVDITIGTRTPRKLSTSELVFRRSLFVLSAVMILALGIFCRFHFSYDMNITSLCIPRDFNNSAFDMNTTVFNGSWVTLGNVTLPVCVT